MFGEYCVQCGEEDEEQEVFECEVCQELVHEGCMVVHLELHEDEQ